MKSLSPVPTEIIKRLADCRKKSDAMGASRADEKAQRAYLGKFAAEFERIVGYSLNAYYTEDPIFSERPEMTLVTRIIELNEVFSQTFTQRGHTRHFDNPCDEEDEQADESGDLPEVKYEFPSEVSPDLVEIIHAERFHCPEPSDDPIMNHIEDVFRKNRGPELGTVST